MKVIFLDIDGVLNPRIYMGLLGKLWESNKDCKSRDDYGHYFAPWAVAELKRILDLTGAKIVISSTWRTHGGLELMIELWKHRLLPGEVYDVTPVFNDNFSCRGDEIQHWINDNTVDAYVIIDDNDDMLPEQLDNFVMTDTKFGLTKTDADKAIGILKNKLYQLV